MAIYDARILVYTVGGLFLGLFFFYEGLYWFRRKRLLEDIPTSEIRSIAMGLVEIYGQAVPFNNTIFKSPFGSKDCVHYKATVEKLVSTGKSSHWEVIKTEEKGDYFYVQDDTGHVLVTTRGAETEVPVDFEWQSGFAKDMPVSISEYAAANSIATKDFFHLNEQLRFREYDIEVGRKIFVLGTAGKNPFNQDLSSEHMDTVMIQKGEDKQTFLISEESKKEELSELKRNSLLGIFGGAALTVGCLFIILFYLNLL
jgi:hypothetical protein